MLTRICKKNLISILLLIFPIFPAFALDIDNISTREEAIHLARQGKASETLSWFVKEIQTQGQPSPKLAADALVVFSWANQCKNGIRLYRKYTPETLPAYGWKAAGRCARDVGWTETAVDFYTKGLALYPEDSAIVSGYIHALVDKNELDQAQHFIEDNRKKLARSTGFLRGKAYLDSHRNETYAALALDIDNISTREEAIHLARQGKASETLSWFVKEIQTQGQPSPKLAADALVVFSWANQCKNGIRLYRKYTPETLPAYGWKAAGRCARDVGWTETAVDFYTKGLALYPEDSAIVSGYIHALVDKNELDRAHHFIEDNRKKLASSADFWMGKAYLHNHSNEPYAALDAVERADEISPGRRYIIREKVFALSAAKMASLAHDLAQEHQPFFSPAEHIKLEGEVVAQHIRWNTNPPVDKNRPFEHIDASLAMIEKFQKSLSAKNPALFERENLRLVFDKMIALHDRHKPADIISLYERLKDLRITIPDYVFTSIAAAYLELRQPETAATLYAEIYAKSPNNNAARIGLFYSLLESGQEKKALNFIDHLNLHEPAWTLKKGLGTSERNPRKLDYEILAGLARTYTNRPLAGHEILQDLFIKSPNNLEIREAYADSLVAIGQPKKAQNRYLQGLALTPDHVGLQIAVARNAFQLHNWREAEKEILTLQKMWPENLKAVAGVDELRVRNLYQIDGYSGIYFGDSSSFNGREYRYGLRVWTRPIDYDWRLYTEAGHTFSLLTDDKIKYNSLEAGAEYLDPDYRLYFWLRGFSADEKFGYGSRGTYQSDDQTSYGYSLGRNVSTPSRALNVGVGAWNLNLSLAKTKHLDSSIAVSLGIDIYDDNNIRLGLTGNIRRTLYRDIKWILANTLYLSSDKNTNQEGHYFAPSLDVAADNEMTITHLTWQDYDKQLKQRLALGIGVYWQQDYGTNPSLTASYWHDWAISKRLYLTYGVLGQLHAYDGDLESNYGAQMDFSWRY